MQSISNARRSPIPDRHSRAGTPLVRYAPSTMSLNSADRTPETGHSPGQFLTAVQAARLIGKNERTLRRGFDQGGLVAPKQPGAYQLDPADLEGFARGRR